MKLSMFILNPTDKIFKSKTEHPVVQHGLHIIFAEQQHFPTLSQHSKPAILPA